MKPRFALGSAEADVFRAQTLKLFLLRAETLGWVTQRGWCHASCKKEAMAWWAGVRGVQEATGLKLFDDEFFRRLSTVEPIKTARGLHVELCALNRQRKAWAPLCSEPKGREGWMA